MFETAQPQAGEPANQPEVITAATEEGGGTEIETVSGEPFLTVRYNKEERPLSKEEAVAYAQKGMNYDKLQNRLKETAGKLSEYENGLHTSEKARDTEAKKQALIDAQLENFMRGNHGVDPRTLPKVVIDNWKRGVPLSEAYLMHSAQQLGLKVKEMEQAAAQAEANRTNAAASMGSAASSGPTRGRQLSEDSIRNMTPEELSRNHERIWTYLTLEK